MIYVNLDGAPIGSSFLSSTLAHEFAHMIEFAKRKPSGVWFNEAQAQLAELWNGYPATGTVAQYLREPDTQLTDCTRRPLNPAPTTARASSSSATSPSTSAVPPSSARSWSAAS